MNRMDNLRLAGIGLVLLLPLFLNACLGSCESCERFCESRPDYFFCITLCSPPFCWPPVFGAEACTENPDECAAMFELSKAAIDTCDAYPEKCAEVLDSYAQSFDAGAEE